MDKPPAQDGDKLRSIFSDNLQPIHSFYLKSGNKAHKHTQETYRQTDRQYK